jgi:predicted MFS family arabinose efflux permease
MSALDPGKTKVSTASLSARTVLGGPAALVIPTEFPWRTVYLWVALLAAVLVIGFMAVRLAREMLAKNK